MIFGVIQNQDVISCSDGNSSCLCSCASFCLISSRAHWLRSQTVDLLKYHAVKSSEAFKMKLCSHKWNVVLTGTTISAINRTSLRLPSHNPGDINIAGPSLRQRLPAIPCYTCYTWVSLMNERGEPGEKNSSLGFCVYQITSVRSSEKGF